jgi:hypothetical protein
MVVILILSPNGSCVINNDVTPAVHDTSTRVSLISSSSSQVDPDSTYATTKEGKCKPVKPVHSMRYEYFPLDDQGVKV